MALNVSKATGCNSISATFLRDAAEVICSPLAYIINVSFKSSTVSEYFKTARVVSVY